MQVAADITRLSARLGKRSGTGTPLTGSASVCLPGCVSLLLDNKDTAIFGFVAEGIYAFVAASV